MAKKHREATPPTTPAATTTAEPKASSDQPSGFQLPSPDSAASTPATTTIPAPAEKPDASGTTPIGEAATPTPTSGTQQTGQPLANLTINTGNNTETRDLAIGFGLVLALLVAMLFAKNSYANFLVARRVPPHSANAAGWWLLISVITLTTGGMLAWVNAQKFFIAAIVFAGVFLLAVIMSVIHSRN